MKCGLSILIWYLRVLFSMVTDYLAQTYCPFDLGATLAINVDFSTPLFTKRFH